MKIRILFLIGTLDIGGAERQLVMLVKGLDKSRFDVTVASFRGGEQASRLQEVDGVRVVNLRKRGRWDVVGFLGRLWSLVNEVDPHIIHGYMNLSNQLALLMGKLRNACIVWGKRNLFRSGFTSNWLPWLTRHLGVSLASYADLIIVNSHAGYHSLIEHGYPAERMTVISNGIDVDYFKPVEGKRLINMCRKWGVTSEDIIIGLAGRIVPRKGHATFLRAAEKLSSIYPDVHFVCIGGGKDGYLAKLRSLSQQLGVEKRVTWAGLETDMPAVYGALDVATNATHSHEGFSNVIGEAMACEVPCVVTDVGDSAFVVGSSGIVVPSQDPAALAQAWERLLNMPVERREELGVVARKRIVQEFSVPILVDRTTEVLEELVMSLDQ